MEKETVEQVMTGEAPVQEITNKQIYDKTKEGVQRVTRVETRLMSLATKMGFDLKDHEDIRVDVEYAEVHIATLDVAYTSVINAARKAGMHGRKIGVWYEKMLIAEMRV